MKDKIFIKVNEKNEVIYTHYMPFDRDYGLFKTEEQLSKEGFLVNNVEEPSAPEGQMPVKKYNKVSGEIYYDFVEIPKAEEQVKQETLESKIKELEEKLASMENLLQYKK